MHPFSILTLGIFIAGYITARWDLVNQLYELAIFAWDHGVIVSTLLFRYNPYRCWPRALKTRSAKGFVALSIFFFLFIIPVERIAAQEASLVSHNSSALMWCCCWQYR
jgi:phosphatidylinositol N-acetylglucosaminyltransferase subunit Q